MTVQNLLVPSDADRLVELLTGSLLASLPRSELRRLTDLGHPASFKAGESVFTQGEQEDDLYLVVHGTAGILTGAADPIEVAKVQVGEVFGELSALTSAKDRTASVEAMSDLSCLVIPGTAIRDAMVRHPEAAAAITSEAQTLATAAFLRGVSAFAPLDDERVIRSPTRSAGPPCDW